MTGWEKGAPDLGRYGLSRVVSVQGEEHLSGEEAYGVLPVGEDGRRAGGPGAQLADLERRHRRRARAEDRIRIAKDTGLANLPPHGFDANRIWCAIVALALDLTAWMQTLALTRHDARRWEPKRLRLRLFTIPATLARHARQRVLHLAAHRPWATVITSALARLRGLDPAPG